MKQFLSLSFVLCLLLILPGCFCKKECGPVRPKPERRYYHNGYRKPSRRQQREAAQAAQEEYLPGEYPAEYYDEEPMMGQEDYIVEEQT